jgi:hypothetical protein
MCCIQPISLTGDDRSSEGSLGRACQDPGVVNGEYESSRKSQDVQIRSGYGHSAPGHVRGYETLSHHTLDERLALKKCDTDLAVHGIIVGGLSSLTADEKSVFTEYELEVKDTLWVREGHQPRLPVVIIKPGGSMKLPEGLVTTIFDQLSEVHLSREYILFLRAPKTPSDAYYLNDAQHPGVLEIDSGSKFLGKADARRAGR